MFTAAAKNYQIHKHDCCSDLYEKWPSIDVRGITLYAKTIKDVDDWRQIWDQKVEPQIGLLPLLWQFRQRTTTHPKDKIYALLPLVNYWGKERPMLANYEWTDSQVYRILVVIMIKVYNSLDVLMGNTTKSEELRNQLPSWVPDWMTDPYPYELERLQRSRSSRGLYKASGGRLPDERFWAEDTLQLKGVAHDVIIEFGEMMTTEDDVGAMKIFSQWEELAGVKDNSQKLYANHEKTTVAEAYWRTLCMDTEYSPKEADDENLPVNKHDYNRAHRGYGREYSTWTNDAAPKDGDAAVGLQTAFLPSKSTTQTFSMIVGQHGTNRTSQRPLSPKDLARGGNYAVAIDESVTSATSHRRLFRTRKGFMGLGPENLQINDTVYVLDGGAVPFLLRDAGDKEVHKVGSRKSYTLVGDCYVHGIMDDELKHEVREEVFLV